VTVTQAIDGLSEGHDYRFQPFALAGTASPLVLGPEGTFTTGVTATLDVTPPVLSRVAIVPKRLRVGARASLRHELSEQAQVAFTVERKASGRRVRGHCVRLTASNRRKPPCVRYTPAGSFTRESPVGLSSMRPSGRLVKRGLKPGAYRITLVATDAAGNRSTARRLSFRVVRPR
jgi:hypothetical protein